VVPNASKPVGDNHVETDQQYQHHGSVFNVAIHFAHHSAQSQQADNLEGTEKRPNTLLLLQISND